MTNTTTAPSTLTPTKTNWFAIVGLITGAIGWSLFGIIFSILGLSKAKAYGNGKIMSWIGLSLSVLWVLIIIVGAILFVALGGLEKGEVTTFTSPNGTHSVMAKDTFTTFDSGNPSAELEYGRDSGDIYFISISEPDTDLDEELTIDEYSDLVLVSEDEGIENVAVADAFFSNPYGYSVNDYTVKATVDNVKIVYYYRIAKVGDTYYQVIAWTLPSKEATNKLEMEEILESFYVPDSQI
jgi:uncharacterized membrane protein